MKKRFWQFVHDQLEQAWHWVYYHKLAKPFPENIGHRDYRYTFTYICGKTGMTTYPSPLPSEEIKVYRS
jgi:hypothetical protein